MQRIPMTRLYSNHSSVLLRAIAGLVLAGCLLSSGCARKYWREQADDVTYDIIESKQKDPRWTTTRTDLQADPRSRFYDPYDPDCPPLPPDDPYAHEYMHWAYGMRGYKHWHDYGDTLTVENPYWLEPFGLAPEVVESNAGRPGVFPDINKLSLEEAVELAYIHNRDYQTQLENLYLQALALTLERFRFDIQFIGFNGRRPSADVNFEDLPSTSDSVQWSPRVGMSKLLPTGGQLIAELANNTLWLFAGGDTQSSTATTLSYSLIQPLLANGGRRFVMESLTQSERNMLYALRDFARFRMGFFTSIVVGLGAAGGGGVADGPTGVGAIATPLPNNGYLGLLQQMQVVNNQRYNIRQTKESLERSRAQASQPPRDLSEPLDALPGGLVFPEALQGKVRYDQERKRLVLLGKLNDDELRLLLALSDDPAYRTALEMLAQRSGGITITQQIAQLQTQLANSCNQLRNSQVNLQDAIDRYKLFLGLPPNMQITIDDSLLKPFELIDPRLLRLQDRLNAFVPEQPVVPPDHPDAEAIRRVGELFGAMAPREPDLPHVRAIVAEFARLLDDLKRDGIGVLDEDFRRVAEFRKSNPPVILSDGCLVVQRDPERDMRLRETLLAGLQEAESRLNKLQQRVQVNEATAEELIDVLLRLSDLRENFLQAAQGISVIQIDLRIELIQLAPFDMSLEQALETALLNRQDLMNARAQVMDARRRVEVAANQLQAVLNIVAAGDIRTKPLLSGGAPFNDNPFDFRGDQSSIRAGVQFTAPVQLVQQRNAYRAALIGYQRARRNYMRTEDQVKLEIRVAWRQLNLLKLNLDTTKEQVRAAAIQLDIAVEQSSAPVRAGAQPAGWQGGGNQGLNLLNALNSAVQSQNNLVQIWVNYEQNRLNIHNLMGIMEIDEFGFWTDEFYQRRASAARAGGTFYNPPPVDPPAASPVEPQEPLDVPQPSVKSSASAPLVVRSPYRVGGSLPFSERRPVVLQTGASKPDFVAARRDDVEYDSCPGCARRGARGLGGMERDAVHEVGQ
jgi:outer membrane protein TolC